MRCLPLPCATPCPAPDLRGVTGSPRSWFGPLNGARHEQRREMSGSRCGMIDAVGRPEGQGVGHMRKTCMRWFWTLNLATLVMFPAKRRRGRVSRSQEYHVERPLGTEARKGDGFSACPTKLGVRQRG